LIPTPYDHSTQDFIGQQLIGSFVGAIDRKLVPTGEQAVGFFVGGGGSYVRDWKIVLPGDPWSLRTTKEVAELLGVDPACLTVWRYRASALNQSRLTSKAQFRRTDWTRS